MEKNSAVIYKNQPAVITGIEDGKFVIKYCSVPASPGGKKAVWAEQKIREKDFVPLHKGPVSSIEKLISFSDGNFSGQMTEAYELLMSDDGSAEQAIPLEELAGLCRGEFLADESWFVYSSLLASAEFSIDSAAFKNGKILFVPRNRQAIESIKQKEFEKSHAEEIRASFISRLKEKKILPEDSKFMGEIEALALGKTEKSKAMQEAGFTQTPEKAHQLLIDTGIWDMTKNPYPSRFGFSFSSASEGLSSMPEEERTEIPGTAYAIDSEYSDDPDDAVAFDGEYLWVHIADPASSVNPDSTIDIAARNRGTTLYIPEGASRMLCENCLADYALGLKEKSSALSFRLKLAEDGQIDDCSVIRTRITVKRLTYRQADEMKDSAELKPLFEIARKNAQRRKSRGAISIRMPEVHISVDRNTKKVSVEENERYESNEMICEMMLLAGEGAAKFAFKNQIPFPYVSQEASSLPEQIPDGLAGQFALIKCMRRRSVGITPAPHSGLGLSFYSQVTSPLRRYGDLVAHQQLRAFIKKQRLMTKDEMLERISAGDAASVAAKKASRLSETHWKLVYLIQNPDWTGEAVCIDRRGNDCLFIIPSLDMQTTISAAGTELNGTITVRAGKIDIPTQKVDFMQL